jgi:hypothetical protein
MWCISQTYLQILWREHGRKCLTRLLANMGTFLYPLLVMAETFPPYFLYPTDTAALCVHGSWLEAAARKTTLQYSCVNWQLRNQAPGMICISSPIISKGQEQIRNVLGNDGQGRIAHWFSCVYTTSDSQNLVNMYTGIVMTSNKLETIYLSPQKKLSL